MNLFNRLRKWNIKNIRNIDNDILMMSKKILKMELIHDVIINKSNITIQAALGLCQPSQAFIENLKLYFSKENDKYMNFSFPTNTDHLHFTCNSKKCTFSSCPILVAGYLYYTEKNSSNKKSKDVVEEAIAQNLESIVQEVKQSNLGEEFINELLQLIEVLVFNTNYNQKIHFQIRYCITASSESRLKAAIFIIERILKHFNIIDSNLPVLDINKIIHHEQKLEMYNNAVYYNISKLINNITGTLKNTPNNKFLIECNDSINRIIDYNCNISPVMIFCDTNAGMDTFLRDNPKLQMIFTKKFILPDLTPKNIASLIMNKLIQSNFQVQDDFFNVLHQYIKNNYRYSLLNNIEYADILYQTIINNTMYTSDKSIIQKASLPLETEDRVETYNLINSMIGLNDIKAEVEKLKSYLIYNKKLKEVTSKVPIINLHMMFLGNPGTGKTSIARLIAQILFDLGYTRTNKFIEADKKTFTGQYVGESTVKTKEVLEKAIGGVLFIDEAYALGQKGSFNEEIVATIIKEMEDRRDELVIIFAGYTKSMDEFLNMNEGIRSRIGHTFIFPDYSAEELAQITINKLIKNDYILTDTAIVEINNICKQAICQKDFGNGRFADLLSQKIILTHASNYVDGQNILEITYDDVINTRII